MDEGGEPFCLNIDWSFRHHYIIKYSLLVISFSSVRRSVTFSPESTGQLVRKDMEANEHERLSNITKQSIGTTHLTVRV